MGVGRSKNVWSFSENSSNFVWHRHPKCHITFLLKIITTLVIIVICHWLCHKNTSSQVQLLHHRHHHVPDHQDGHLLQAPSSPSSEDATKEEDVEVTTSNVGLFIIIGLLVFCLILCIIFCAVRWATTINNITIMIMIMFMMNIKIQEKE